MTVTTTISLDPETKKILDAQPRNFNLSKLVRDYVKSLADEKTLLIAVPN